MSLNNHVVVIGDRVEQAVAAASFLESPGVAMVGCAEVSEHVWTSKILQLRRADVDTTGFRRAAGPDDRLCPQDVSADEVANADVLLVDCGVPFEVVRSALYHARGKVVLTPAPSPEWAATFAPFVHTLVPDPMTVAALDGTGQDPYGPRIASLTSDLAQRLQVNVVVPFGGSGALLARPDRAPKLAEVDGMSDDRAADDAFRGVLAALLATRTPLSEAVRTAARAASTSDYALLSQ